MSFGAEPAAERAHKAPRALSARRSLSSSPVPCRDARVYCRGAGAEHREAAVPRRHPGPGGHTNGPTFLAGFASSPRHVGRATARRLCRPRIVGICSRQAGPESAASEAQARRNRRNTRTHSFGTPSISAEKTGPALHSASTRMLLTSPHTPTLRHASMRSAARRRLPYHRNDVRPATLHPTGALVGDHS